MYSCSYLDVFQTRWKSRRLIEVITLLMMENTAQDPVLHLILLQVKSEFLTQGRISFLYISVTVKWLASLPINLIFFPSFLYETNQQPPPATESAISSRGDVRLRRTNNIDNNQFKHNDKQSLILHMQQIPGWRSCRLHKPEKQHTTYF